MLPSVYDPKEWESALYAEWEREGDFKPVSRAGAGRFALCIAPPNVTGRLHIGHALENTVVDALVRWHRMRGEQTLWLPGTDHAGIATQAVVARRLGEEGVSYRDLGREAFVDRVWAWKAEYERAICDQIRRMGWSVDWSRLRFTMDPGLSRAVARVFASYYRDGLIYRGERIVNWCPGCRTAISDIEVEHEDEPGALYHIRYPLEGGGEIVIATVRPETMLGDTAVAVHPDDDRYRDLVGRFAILPLVGRRIPIVADAHVEPEFGTGALKVTPGHDADDFEIGQRHDLPSLTVIGTDARMTAAAGAPYAGLDRFEARKRVVEDLRAQGALVREEPYTVAVGRCERCHTVIEPLILLQWFVRVRPLVEPVLAALRAGELRIVPERFTRILEQGLENEHDWCVSRQLWWGHRIPAWYCERCREVTVAEEPPAACAHCGGTELRQDPDVLDTWFSSALWPFSTLGWPEETADLRRFYPNDLVCSGYDILLKWDMKMAWSGLRFTGQLPFPTVLLHGLVRDGAGRKMSKSAGNVVDPLEAVDRFGADAVRFAMITGVAPGNDSRFTWEKVEGAQHFANKLWNAARLVLQAVDGGAQGVQAARGPDGAPAAAGAAGGEAAAVGAAGGAAAGDGVTAGAAGGAQAAGAGMTADGRASAGAGGIPAIADEIGAPAGGSTAALADRWIRSRLAACTADVDAALAAYDVGEAASRIHTFVWSEFCDWYLEAVKPRLYGRATGGAAARATLHEVLDAVCRLLHPIMPFVTDAIWRQLPGSGRSVITAAWPAAGPRDPVAEAEFARVMEVITTARALRAEQAIAPGARVRIGITFPDGNPQTRPAWPEGAGALVRELARAESVELDRLPGPGARAVTAEGITVHIGVSGADLAAQKKRLQRDLAAAESELERVGARLDNAGFLAKARPEVIARERQRQQDLTAAVGGLRRQLEEIR